MFLFLCEHYYTPGCLAEGHRHTSRVILIAVTSLELERTKYVRVVPKYTETYVSPINLCKMNNRLATC